jgi:hypothetical protein
MHGSYAQLICARHKIDVLLNQIMVVDAVVGLNGLLQKSFHKHFFVEIFS